MKKLLFVTMALLMATSFAWGQDRDGTISGTILAQTDSVPQPLSGAHIAAFHLNGQMPVATAMANAEGHYTLHVPYGEYQIRAEANHFNGAWYNNVPERAQATTVAVTAETNPIGIDFLLIHVTPPPPPVQGTISGIVTGEIEDSIIPLRYAHVLAFPTDGNMPAGTAFTDSLGQYTLHLNYGQYVVRAEAMNFVSLWYNNVPERAQATVLAVGDSSNPAGIDFRLQPPAPPVQGTISGIVTGQHEGNVVPLRYAHVLAFPANGNMPAGAAFADSLGQYTLHLNYGQYVVRAEAMNFVSLWYNNVPERSQATVLAVGEGSNPEGINFLLLPPAPPPPPPGRGTISGIVLGQEDSNTVQLPAMVYAYPVNGDHPAAMTMTDRSGTYTLNVTFGGYQIRAEAYHFIPQWYNNVPERAQATVVAVADSVNPTGINFLLLPQGPPPPPPPPVSGISGVVTNAIDNSPIPGAMVTAIKVNNHWMHRMVRTDSLGAYLIPLQQGEYIVQVNAHSFVPAEYPTHVVVAENTIVPNVNFALTAINFGSIAGTVTDSNGVAVPGAFVEARKLGRPFTMHTRTDSTGAYTFAQVIAGSYRVRAYKHGLVPGVYPDSVVVDEGQDVTGINIVMGIVPPPFNGTIAGLVTADSTGTPIAHAMVVAVGGNDGRYHWRFRYTFTNDDGTYLLDGLSQVPYKVFCAARSYVGEFYDNVRNYSDATPVTPNAIGINFGLAACDSGPRAFGGYVLMPDGIAEGAIVYAIVDGAIVGVTVSDPDGYYTFEGIAPGTYDISVASIYGDGQIAQPVDAGLNDVGDADVILNATSVGDQPLVPTSSSLAQNYPNPFNAQTMIAFNLENAGQVQLDVYNMIGQKIATLVNGNYNSGSYNVIWNGRDASGSVVSSGIYYYRLKTATTTETMKMTLLK